MSINMIGDEGVCLSSIHTTGFWFSFCTNNGQNSVTLNFAVVKNPNLTYTTAFTKTLNLL